MRGKSGLPLPRFVSLKSGRVNSRIGPGVTYAVDWRT
jgi:SH3-like domain-containing protein